MEKEILYKTETSQESIFKEILGRNTRLNKEAIIGINSLTYGDLLKNAEKLSVLLKAQDIQKGDIIGVCLHNSVSFVCTILALYQINAICLLINPQIITYEYEYIFENSQASFLITKDDVRVVRDINNKFIKHLTEELILGGAFPRENYKDEIHPADCMIVYTSGSLGKPKGVMLTDNGISNNVKAVCDYLELTSEDKTIVFTPPAYTYAISQIFTHLWVGGALLPYPHGLRFPYEIHKYVSDYGITGIAANPTSFQILSSSKIDSEYSFDSVRYVMSGGQPLQSSLVVTLSKLYKTARIVNMYGCTENSPRISFYWLPKEILERETPWPVGVPINGTRIKIVDDSGGELPKNDIGQIYISGNSMMRAYWRDPNLTQERVKEGWFNTGDLGFIDTEGLLNLTGRIDNIINVGHEKVSPEEIEEVIRTVDKVLDVGVTSIEDNLLGNKLIAFIVHNEKPNDELLASLKHECRKKLSFHKQPYRFIQVQSLPKTLYGKIDRRGLKELTTKFDQS